MTDLILLHGALASKEQLQPLADRLSPHYSVHLFNLNGHGGLDLPAGPYSFDDFNKDIAAYMEANGLEKADFFGYSMGGYAATYFAMKQPERVGKIITLATKWIWDIESTEKELQMLNTDAIEQKVPKFAAMLTATHAPNDWKVVVQKTAEMMKGLTVNPNIIDQDMAALQHEILVCVGEQDQTADPVDTKIVQKLITNSQLWLIPDTPHPFHKVPLDDLAVKINEFLG